MQESDERVEFLSPLEVAVVFILKGVVMPEEKVYFEMVGERERERERERE